MDESVTVWIAKMRDGDPQGAQQIWQRYYEGLLRVARRKLFDSERRAWDEEDIVSMAIEQLWNGLQDGRFPKLEDRQDLWQVLLMLTERRAIDANRRTTTRRKHEASESSISPPRKTESEKTAIDQISSPTPTPEFAAAMMESLKRSLHGLEDDTLREVTLFKLQGMTNREIAERLGCVERTVERKILLIRQRFDELAEDNEESCE